MTQVVIKVIGNYSYQTSKCLGEGVYGKVYEGMERETKEKVAIKKIDLATFTNDKYLENAIFSEIYLLKRFNHPNIVKFKDVLSSKNSLYIITEYCKNGDLKELIKRRKFKEEESFEIMQQIMSGFSELIREKIVHRDLKPANILISEGVYKIGDFGFAKYVDNFGSQMLKSCVGSPIYMAPQILERAHYSTKCDIWSVGIIFYEMLFGYPPWKARDESELLRGIKTIPITHILKRNSNNLSNKALQFLKRTLAYSEEERIGWGDLFEMFGGSGGFFSKGSNEGGTSFGKNSEQQMQYREQNTSSPLGNVAKERSSNRLASNNTISGGGSGNNPNTSLTNLSGNNTSVTGTGSWDKHLTSNRNLTSGTGNKERDSASITNNQSSNNKYGKSFQNIHSNGSNQSYEKGSPTAQQQGLQTNHKSSPQGLESVLQWRQFCIYYHFYAVQLYENFKVARHHLGAGSIEAYGQLILVLSLMVKYKSTYCLSLVSSIHHSNRTSSNRQLEESLFKRMKVEHDSYEMIYNEISNKLDSLMGGSSSDGAVSSPSSALKSIRNEIYSHVGRSETMSEEKIDKVENIMIKYANENAQLISEEVRKKAKTLREIKIVEILNYVLEVLSLGMGKQKALKELKEAPRNSEDEDLKDYIARVISKLDRITLQ